MKNSFHQLLFAGALTGVLLSGMVWANPKAKPQPKPATAAKAKPKAKPAPPKTPEQIKAEYIKRVRAVNYDLVVPFAELSLDAKSYGESMMQLSIMKDTGRGDGEFAKFHKEIADEKKKRILANMPKVRAQLKRLKAISPVPTSMKKVDTAYIHACNEAESALSMIEYGVKQGDFAPAGAGASNFSKAFDLWSDATKQLDSLAPVGQPAKKYVDG